MFAVQGVVPLEFACGEPLASMYKLSPFVWRATTAYGLMLRVVNVDSDPSRKVARIHAGHSSDGLRFVVDESPVIAPAPDIADADSGGCEDPTLAYVGGTYYVYYTGWNESRKSGKLLLADGPDPRRLVKRNVALEASDGFGNPKEATIVQAPDRWLLFFEFARDDRSWIGVAESTSVAGPWRIAREPFESRDGVWDSWHLSPGPVVDTQAGPVMFYNGATRDAAWRIGWVLFDPAYRRVVARSELPLLAPGDRRASEDTDIAFASSALVEQGRIALYYSVADRYCMRAALRT